MDLRARLNPRMWEFNGIEGRGDPPSIAGTCTGTLLIMGSAACLWDDMDNAPQHNSKMAVNFTGMFYPKRIDHWTTLHPDWFSVWVDARTRNCNPTEVQTHSHIHGEDVKNVWDIPNIGGTSGLFSVLVGLALGYERIILAGIPLDNTGHFWVPHRYQERKFIYDDGAIKAVWKQAICNIFKGRVTSLSGNTRKWMGAPNV